MTRIYSINFPNIKGVYRNFPDYPEKNYPIFKPLLTPPLSTSNDRTGKFIIIFLIFTWSLAHVSPRGKIGASHEIIDIRLVTNHWL